MTYQATIVIPILNEINFIKDCINSIKDNNSNFNCYEVFLIDGGSTDGTKALLADLASKYTNIQTLENPKKYAASAMNIGIKKSTTDLIIRLDAHAIYLDSYIQTAINILKSSNKSVANIGGSIITKQSSNSNVSFLISFVLSSPFGVGNSVFRTKKLLVETEVDTVPFGCFKKKAIIEVGLYNEEEIRGEDLDLNTRLIKNGYKVILSPQLRSIYYSRENYFDFIKQAFTNGKVVLSKRRGTNSYHKVRHYIPLLFVSFQLLLILQLFLFQINLLSIVLIIIFSLYFFLAYFFSIKLLNTTQNIFNFIFATLYFYSLHTFYGLGSLYSIFKNFLQINNK